jgi:hypothetical protein
MEESGTGLSDDDHGLQWDRAHSCVNSSKAEHRFLFRHLPNGKPRGASLELTWSFGGRHVVVDA